jgi:hypothetical protein
MHRTLIPVAAVALLSGCRTNMENTTAPPGDPNAFVPFSQVAAAGAYAGRDAKLLSIEIRRISASGKIRLTGALPSAASYDFVATDEDGERVSVKVNVVGAHDTNRSTGTDGETPLRHLGMERAPSPLFSINRQLVESQAIAAPKCSETDLWKKAIAAGAPADAEASIHYDATGYRFSVARPTGPMLQFGSDCSLVR